MFENFSKINYYLNGQTLELTDIFKSIKIDTSNSPDINTTKNINFERPDQLSNTLYNDPKLFWVNLALNNIKNPFKEWGRSNASELTQNSADFDTKVFQFGNTSNYLPQTSDYFNTEETDSYLGISLSNIQQDDIIIFETGSGALELKTYGAGILSAASSCGYPHFGQSDIPDNFLNRNNIIQISCGRNFTACLDDLGYIWAWGEDIGLEASGFILNGRLYKSGNGGYKHIDTTHNKIIAVTSTGDFACFGSCGDFTFTGQVDIKKSSWTSGQTLAGVGIKNDNSIIIFGPIVSTNSTAQYFSDVSCADDYCLGAVTGSANNIVVGFGSTGYFEQIGQNTFYSAQLTELQPIPTISPLYPFTDNNHSIIKKNEQDVLEVKIKDLEPFTSPTKDSEIFYRSDYNSVYSSGSFDYNLLLGFTDKNLQSKDGYILNNSKLLFKNSTVVKDLEYKIPATTGITYSYNYSLNYDENLKPIRPLDLVYKPNYLGITNINNVIFTAGLQTFYYIDNGQNDYVWEYIPTFYSTYKNNSPKTPFNGPLDKDDSEIYDTSAHTNLHSFYEEPKGISFVTTVSDPAYTISVKQDGFLAIERSLPNSSKSYFLADNLTNDENLYIEYINNRNTVNINGISAACTSVGGEAYLKSLGKIKSLSKNNTRFGYAITENGTPLTFTHNNRDFSGWKLFINDIFGLSPDANSPYHYYREAVQPPAGITFSYLEPADFAGFWSAGIDANKNLLIFGVTAELQDNFGYTGGFVYNPGITVDSIYVGRTSVTTVKNGKISIFGSGYHNYNFSEVYGQYLPGGTVTNAIKVAGPMFPPYYDDVTGRTFISPLFVLDNTDTLKIYGQTLGDTEGSYYRTNNIKYQYYEMEKFDPKYSSQKDNLRRNAIPNALKTDGIFSNIKNFEGDGLNCLVTRMDGSTFKLFGNMYVFAPAYYSFIWDAQYFYGITNDNVSLTYVDPVFPSSLIKNNETGTHIASDIFQSVFYPYYSFGVFFWDLCHDDVYNIPVLQSDKIKWSYSRQYRNIYPEDGARITIPGLGGNQFPGDYSDLIDGIDDPVDLLYGGLEETHVSLDSKYGISLVFNNNKLSIYSAYKYFDWKMPWSINISKTVVGDGFIILAHPNKTVTFLHGTTPPHNNTLEKFVNFNPTSIYPNPSLEGFWRETVGSYSYSNGNWYILPQQQDLPNPSAGVTVYPVKYWGTNNLQNELPQNLPYIPGSLSCNANHCCALVYTDNEEQQYQGLGNVVCWGRDTTSLGTAGPLTPPSDLGVCLGVWAGWDHSCAYDSLGNLRCWGSNEYGQCNVPSSVNGALIRNIVLGKYFSVALMFDGKLIAWGLGLTGAEPPADSGFITTPLNIEIE